MKHLLIMAVVLTGAVAVAAGDKADLLKRLEDLEKQLDGDGAVEAPAPAEETKHAQPAVRPRDDDLRARLEKLEIELGELKEELEDEKDQKGFISFLKERFDMGGEIEIEFVEAESEWNPATDAPSRSEDSPFMRIDKIRLSPMIRFTKNSAPISVIAQGDLDFLSDTGRARVKELYVTFEGLHTEWAASRLRIGLDDRFMRPDCETEFWPLAATTFWRRETLGLFWRTQLGDQKDALGEWDLLASLTNGSALDDREPGEGEDDFVVISQDARTGFGESELREIGVGLGWEKRWCDRGDAGFLGRIETEFLGFYYNDSLGDDDLAFYSSSFNALDTDVIWSGSSGGTPRAINGREMWGGNALLTVGGLWVLGHVAHGRDGKLKRKTGYVETAYEWEFPDPLLMGEYIRSVTPLVRHGWLRSDLPREPSNTLTWDRERWTVALLTELRRNVMLKVEYVFNEEDIGGGLGDPDTDELLIQLELTF